MHTQPLPRGAQAFCNQVSTSTTQRYSRNICNTCGHPKSISSHHIDLCPLPRHNLQCSMKPREPDSSLKLPFYCQFIPFFSYTERLISKNFNIVYSYMFFIFQVTARRGDYRPLPPSLVTRSTKLKNPSEQPPKNQGACGRKEQFLKIDCSIGRDQHTWVFCCDQ